MINRGKSLLGEKASQGRVRSLLFIILGLTFILTSIALAAENGPDKICYNGELNRIEDGRDFCIHRDNNKEYIPCMEVFGRCGRITYLNVIESEENSYIPIVLTFMNPGKITLKPSVKVDLQKIDTNIVLSSFEEELGDLKSGQEKTYLLDINNSGIAPGKYELWVTVMSGRKEILQKFEYEIMVEGTIARKGELELESPMVSENLTKISGTYTNGRNLPYTISMNIKLYRDNVKVSENESDQLYIKQREVKEISYSFEGLEPGNYEAIVNIKNTNLTKSTGFSIEPKEIETKETEVPTGNFAYTNLQVLTIFLAITAVLLSVLIIVKVRKISRQKSRRKKELI